MMTCTPIRIPTTRGRFRAGRPGTAKLARYAMELNVHSVLLAFGDPARARPAQEIEAVLREFNAIRESEEGGSSDFEEKTSLLQKELARLGYGHLDLAELSQFGYDVEQAADNRRRFLTGPGGEALTEESYPGVCLEGGSRCKSD